MRTTTAAEHPTTRLVSVPMPVPLADAVRRLADSDDRSMASVVRSAISTYLEIRSPRRGSLPSNRFPGEPTP